jgi:TPR repeat protein
VSALTNLGQLHDRGLIPDADPVRARLYYEEATALGNRHAPWHLAANLECSVPAEEVEALRDLAAERGFAPDPAAPEATV